MDWEGIRTAIVDRERKRLGLPSRMELEAKRAEMARAAAESASGLESEALGREKTRAEITALPAEQDMTRRLREAQIRNYDEPPRADTPGTLRPLVNSEGEITGFYNEKTGEIKTGVPGGLRTRATAAPPQGNVRLVNTTDPEGNPVQRAVRLQEGQEFGPAPTAEMRNTEYQSGAVEPAFELVKQSLEGFKQAGAGGLPGAPSAMIPGTDAYYAMSRFRDQAKALLGAIVARQAGEGSRLSDEDRVAYSQAASLVNGAIMLPGGPEEAGARIEQARNLITTVMARRKQVGAGQTPTASMRGGSAAPSVAPGGNIRVQRNRVTGESRYSTDGGATWQPGSPPQ